AGPALGLTHRVEHPSAEPDVPVLASDWTVWLPPGYEPVGGGYSDPGGRTPQWTWTQRLFGPLGRSAQQEDSGQTHSCGTHVDPIHEIDSEMQGWTPWRVETTATGLSVVYQPRLRMTRWLALLVAIGLIQWRLRRSARWLVACTGVAIAMALIGPIWLAPIGSGIFLGVLLWGAWRAVCGGVEAVQTDDAVTTHAALSTAVFRKAVWLLFLLIPASVWADTATPTARPNAPVEARVVVPVDKDRHPSGQWVFVSESLFNALDRLAAANDGRGGGGLITDVLYRGNLEWQGTPRQLALDSLVAEISIQTFDDPCRIVVPLPKTSVAKGIRMLLDGQSVQAKWEENGQRFSIVMAEPGTHRLEVPLRPVAWLGSAKSKAGWAGGFDVPVGRLAGARLELNLPSDAPVIEVPSARGSVKIKASRLVAGLGPIDRLAVRWGAASAGDSAARDLEVEELLRLRVAPGSVVVDAQFNYRVLRGQVDELLLDVDPRWRLLETESGDALTGLPDEPRLRRVRLETPATERASVRTRFLLKGASGVGSLRLPELTAHGARVTRRWLAVSVDPALECRPQPAGALAPVAVADFQAAWSDEAVRPETALDLTGRPDSPWSLRVVPRPSRTLVDQSVALSFGAKSVWVHLDAQLLTTDGYGFAYRLDMPPAIRVQSVCVLEDGRDRVVRWSQSGPTLSVFLDGPVTLIRRLLVEGRMNVDRLGDLELGLPCLEGSETHSSRVSVFRRPSVEVDVRECAGLVETGTSVVDSLVADYGRLVASFAGDNPQPAHLAVRLRPNRPRVNATQTTTMRLDGSTWRAEVDVELTVRRGVLDEIQVQTPPEWKGPLDVTPAVAVRSLPSNDSNDDLVLRPDEAVTDSFSFRVTGPVPGPRVVVPQVVVRGVEKREHWVRLPRRIDQSPIRWETRRLRRAVRPTPDKHVPEDASENWTTYQVVGDQFQAVLAPTSTLDGRVKAELADVRLAWQADGVCHGVATYYLDPAGRTSCPLALPEGCQLVRLTVAGVPTTPTAAKDSSESGEQIRLTSRTLPQPVELVFTGRVSLGPDGQREFEIPRLGDVPLERVLWTVTGPAGYTSMESPLAGALDQAVERARAFKKLIDPILKGGHDDPDDLGVWLAIWQDRWQGLIDALDRRAADAEAQRLAAELRRDLKELTAQLTPMTTGPTDTASSTVSPPVPRGELPAGPGETIHAITHEGGRLSLIYRETQGSGFSGRLLAALAVLGLTVGVYEGLRRGIVPVELSLRWVYALGVPLGLFWWFFLWPGPLGLVIAVASLVAAWRVHLHATDHPAPDAIRVN
ncbi:MAG: hypothetical protein JW818_05085, partial [Pirellulales bacterium]|nr:hypothetical protein [Pirellulales bacterium]